MNWQAVNAIYRFEMSRTMRTLWQSIVSPVISTSLYFVVFGAAIGSRITEIEGVSYGAFIVPGAIGVQEGGFLFTGGLIGLSPELALALALARRARDIIVFVPALLFWQIAAGRRAFGRD